MQLSEIVFYAPPIKCTHLDGTSVITGVTPAEPYTPERLQELNQEYMRRREENRKLRERMTTKFHDIPSKSDPNKTYRVTEYTNGMWECECKGFEFRRNCSHIKKAKELV